MRVLVVEDFEVLARTVGAGLRREGMAVDVALDGDDALEHLAITRYDVVVLDRDLPGVPGDEVCRRIVAEHSTTRVLMLTAAGAANAVATRHQHARRQDIQVHTVFERAPAAGDPDLIERMVVNLVDNAVRHNTAGGHVEIITTTTARGASIRVGNTGPVVPPDEIEALFQPFRQLGGRRVRHADGHGHGLGLPIVRAIASTHGARVNARPRSGGGLDIEVTFP